MKKNTPLKIIIKKDQTILTKIVILSILSLISSLTAILFAYFSKEAIDRAISNEMNLFLIYAIVLSLLLLTQIITSIINPYLKIYFQTKTDIHLKSSLHDRIIRAEILKTSKYHTGSWMNYLYSDIKLIAEGIYDVFPRLIYYLSRFFGAFILLYLLDDLLAIFLFLCGLVLVLLSPILSREIKKRHHRLQEEETKVRQLIQESLEHIEVIKSYEKESALSNDFKNRQNSYFKSLMRKTLLTVFAQGGMTLFFAIGYGAAIIFGAIRLSEGIITFGTLTAIIQLVSHIQAPFSGLSQIIPKYYSMIASSERLQLLDQLQVEKKEDRLLDDFDQIEIKDVSFSYLSTPVIKHLSKTISKGSVCLIKGSSGRGKTTMIKLLLGFFEPSKGTILISYQNKNYKIDASTRHLFSYVPQSQYIVSGTIRENLCFYQDLTDEKIYEATKIAEIYDDIIKLPNGLDTLLGERGYGLSLGQVQRLAIARALLRDTPIYLFDEITSALDQTTEKKILSNLNKLKDKTIFMISHRDIESIYYQDEIEIK